MALVFQELFTSMIMHLLKRKAKLIQSLTLLLVLCMGMGCSSNKNPWEGAWQAKTEIFPDSDFETTIELQLMQVHEGDDWEGEWSIPELLGQGRLTDIEITDSLITMYMEGAGVVKGKLNERADELRCFFYPIVGEGDSIILEKAKTPMAQMRARSTESGNRIKWWQYNTPPSTKDGWSTAIAKQAQRLRPLFQRAISGKYQGLDAVLVAQNGQLIIEEYFHLGGRDRLHTLQSCTKSVTSLLLGMAYDEGLITDLDQPIGQFFPQYLDSMPSETATISLRYSLSMSGGVDWAEDVPFSDPRNDLIRMNASQDLYHYVLSKSLDTEVKPGERFEYNSGLSMLLGGVIAHATGMPVEKYAEEGLFEALDIENYYWQQVNGQTHTGGGLLLRPRDLLKLGQLVLDSGRWKGKQVISKELIEESTATFLPVSPGNKNHGYGYQWWTEDFNVQGQKHASVIAMGHGGQFLWVLPSLNAVVLTMHHNAHDEKLEHTIFRNEMVGEIIPFLLKEQNSGDPAEKTNNKPFSQ